MRQRFRKYLRRSNSRLDISRRNRIRSAIKHRPLKHEQLEDRAMLSVTILAETFKAWDFAATGDYSGNATGPTGNPAFPDITIDFTGTATATGTATYSSPTEGVFSTVGVSGSGTYDSDLPAGTIGKSGDYGFTASGSGTDANGTVDATGGEALFTGLPLVAAGFGAGPFAASGTFATSNFLLTIDDIASDPPTTINSAFWSGTMVPDPVLGAFDASVTSVAWNGDDVDVAFEVTGAPAMTPSHATPVGTVELFWASGPTAGDIIGSPFADTLPIYWNQATGSATITDLPAAPAGATHLLVQVDASADLNATNDVMTVMMLPTDTAGFYRTSNSTFHLRDSNAPVGTTEFYYQYGPGGSEWIPLTGDWDGDGKDSAGFYRTSDSTFHLRTDSDELGATEFYFEYGPGGSQWIPISGDWDGDGKDAVGFFRTTDSTFHLRSDSDEPGISEFGFAFGPGGSEWIPIAGDWDGDGRDSVGFYKTTNSTFHLRSDVNDPQTTQFGFAYGSVSSEWVPVAGDWDGDGKDAVGFFRSTDSTFHLRSDSDEPALTEFWYRYGPTGGVGWIPLAGNWDGPALPPVSAALQLDGAASTGEGVASLTPEALDPIVDQAIADWAAAGLSAESLSVLENVEFAIADLPGRVLGLSSAETVTIDTNAAGNGWFVDPTPGVDEEFQFVNSTSTLVAVHSEAVDAVDLLSVVRHELGHVLGLSDLEASLNDIMSESLKPGVRRGI